MEAVPDVDFSGIRTKIIQVAPRELKLLDTNARFMRHEQFQRLVENVRRDGRLTSVPFCSLEPDGRYLVLSGNHRVMAAVEAGLEEIDVMVTDSDLTEQQKVAIQLSHNAIVGEDDPSILKLLYDQIDDVDMRLYSGLDDKTLEMIENVQIGSLSEVNLDFTTVSMTFLPDEVDQIESVWAQARKEITADRVWLAKMESYESFLDAIELGGKSFGVTNVSTSLEVVLRVFQDHIDDLIEGYRSQQESRLSGKTVPLEVVTGVNGIPAKTAIKIADAIKKLRKSGSTDEEIWESIEISLSGSVPGKADKNVGKNDEEQDR